jgi:hypothetical protein
MVKLSKELSLGVLLVLIVIMVLKPNLLGFLYNNVLGKLVFVAAVVFLSLKHTAAGLLAVVFVAIVATMSGYHGFEGMDVPAPNTTPADDAKPCEGEHCDAEKENAKKSAAATAEGLEMKKNEHNEGLTPQQEIEKLLKKK